METKTEQISPLATDPDKIQAAARIIKSGGVVAFPTETVYGLGGDAKNPSASKKIYEAKGRPSDNPLIVHIAEYKALEAITKGVPEPARQLAKRFWPGPLTMIFQKNGEIPPETTGGLDTVAVRMPNHPVALALIRESGGYIAAPSANVSGKPSPTLARHVKEDLGGRIPLILDGGPVGIGIESTIIDVSENLPTILRPGSITKEMMEEAIGPVSNVIVRGEKLRGDERPKAPGTKYKHYAPKAEMVLVAGTQEEMISKVKEMAEKAKDQGKNVGILATEESSQHYLAIEFNESQPFYVKSIGARSDKEGIARHLYAILREFDDVDVDVIYAESVEGAGIAEAIRNRMNKAAGVED